MTAAPYRRAQGTTTLVLVPAPSSSAGVIAELLGPGHVGALAHDEGTAGLLARDIVDPAHVREARRHRPARLPGAGDLRDLADVLGRRAAAAAHQVHPALLDEPAERARDHG